MMSGDLPGRSCWVALGMKTEPTHRPVDGHHSPPIRASPYGERLGQWSRPRVEKMVSLTADWYGFEELVWPGSRGGRGEQFRTAAVFQPSDEGATIANQFGYGAELSTV
jgi:hypothetical protein